MTGLPPFIWRSATVVALLSGAALVAAVACGGDEGSDPVATGGAQRTMPVSRATFTPIPPNFTPEALQTRAALQTAYWETATAQPQVSATAPPNVTVPTGPLATAAPYEIRPPDAFFVTSVGQVAGSVGSFTWFNTELMSWAIISAPYIFVGETGSTWALNTPAQVVVPESDFAVTGADVAIYDFDANMVIPTDPSGNPMGDRPAFFERQPPLQQQRIDGSTISILPNVPPGRYIVSVRIDFQTPAELPDPLYTHYVFSVNVI